MVNGEDLVRLYAQRVNDLIVASRLFNRGKDNQLN